MKKLLGNNKIVLPHGFLFFLGNMILVFISIPVLYLLVWGADPEIRFTSIFWNVYYVIAAVGILGIVLMILPLFRR